MVATAVSTRMYLASGDDLSDAIDLMAVAGDTGVFVELDGFSAPTPKESDSERTVMLNLLIRATNAAMLALQKNAIERLLDQADRSGGAPGGAWMGTPVVLAVSWLDNPTILYFDLKRPAGGGRCGFLEEKKRDFGPYSLQQWTLTLTCHPLLRGSPRTYPTSGPVTITNGLSGYVFLPDIPGDADALCQVTLTDISTGTAVVNGVHLARRSLRGMQSGDFAPVLKFSPQSPGAWAADTTALSGVHVARLAVNSAWRAVALATSTGTGLNHGPLDLWVRWRDSSALLDAPYNLTGTVTPGGGSAPADTYTFVVSEIDGSGNETIGSDPFTVVYSGGSPCSIALTWTVVGSPANHKVYVYTGIHTVWDVFTTGSSSGAYTLTAAPGSPSGIHPPASSSAALSGGAIRARVALAGSSVFSPPGPELTAVLGSSRYEYGYVNTWQLPPMHQMEGYGSQGWQVLIEAKDTGSGAPNIDVDGVWLLPHALMEPQLVAEVDGLALATKRTWVLDGRRDGRSAGMLTDGSGNSVLQITPRGWFTLGHGGNCVIMKLLTQNGVVDCTDAKVSMSLRVVSRWRHLNAAVA